MAMTYSEMRSPIMALTHDELIAWCVERGQPAYRAGQICHWIFRKRAADFSAMDNLPQAFRVQLEERFSLFASRILRHQVSQDGTEKLLLAYPDGEQAEAVLMREGARRTLCLSSQVGCAMGCVFCASGLQGVKRNLTTEEILDQVLRLDRLLADEEQVTNIVVMGLGEPLANLSQLLPALERIHADQGMGLGARRITISTVGLPEKMHELAACGTPYHLAVSLHAPNDELRSAIVPVNKKIGIAAILSAADDYVRTTGRRVTYEYVLLRGRNDAPEQAQELASLLKGHHAHVNLIPMNPVAAIGLQGTSMTAAQQFAAILRGRGINATIRKRKGADIDAACGQLRLKEQPHVASTQ